jgi:hypothetical protein
MEIPFSKLSILFAFLWCVIAIIAQNETMAGMNMTSAVDRANFTTNTTGDFQDQCEELPITVSNTSDSNGIFINGSCFIAIYMPKVPYNNISSTCTKVMKTSNSSATCQGS